MKRRSLKVMLLCFIFAGCFYFHAFAANPLGVRRFEQEKDQWCWAACMQMVGTYMTRNNYSQTTIVDEVKGAIVNEGAQTSEVASGLTNIWRLSASINTSLTFDLCQAHILNSRPFVMFVRWNTGHAHFIVCDGYSTSAKTIHVIDPWYGCGATYVSYADAISSCKFQTGTGRWTHTVELI